MIFAAILISPTAVSQTCQQYDAVEVVIGGCTTTVNVTFTAELNSVAGHFLPLSQIGAVFLGLLYLGIWLRPLNLPALLSVRPVTPPPRFS